VDKTEQAIRNALVEGQLPCAAAFVIAKSLGVEPLQVGHAADRMGVRLSKCQLGLFGYGPKAEGKHRRVKSVTDAPSEVVQAIRGCVQPDGKLNCVDGWRIAHECHVSKQFVSNAVEGLGLRIKLCQLGAF
jgi:hypothetical protein